MRGLVLRICLIVLAALTVVVAINLAILSLRDGAEAARWSPLPLPGQVSAIVQAVEGADPEDEKLLLAALSSPLMRVDVKAGPPGTEGKVTMPLYSRIVGLYLDELGGRSVQVALDVAQEPVRPGFNFREGRFWTRYPFRLVVGLEDGRWLVMEFRSQAFARFTGLRLTMIVLIVTIIAAGVTLWAVQRQIRPIVTLADAVDRFGERLEVPELKEEGASEVRRLIAAVTRMQTRIRDLVAGRTRILAAIGHDLGTYMTRLRLRAEFIADEAQRERAIRDIEDMHALMLDTLTLARLEEEGEPDAPFDLAGLVREKCRSFPEEAGPVHCHLPQKPVEIGGHRIALGRAVNNLVSNALKYGKEAEVTLEADEEAVRLVVEDRGPGIPPEERETVFDPFYRRDASRNLDAGGFGLGLAIVADIVRRHSGTIFLADRPGGGLTVTIILPRRTVGAA